MRYERLLVAGHVLTVGIPEIPEEAQRGLLGFDALDDTQGLSYRPAPSLHTGGMLMEIDILWLDETGNIVCVDESVPAERVIAPRTNWAVEVAGGWVKRNLTMKT